MRCVVMICVFIVAVSAVRSQTVEAENGTLSGTQKSTQRAGYQGSGYVTGFDADGDKVTVSITVNAGIYNLYIRYASPSGDKYNFVYVNDQNVGSVAFPLSTSFTEAKVGKVYLKKGANEISIVKDWGYFDVDNFRVEASEASDYNNISASLVTPSPSVEADSLYKFLSGLYGKVILSGQYGGETEFNRIKNVSGKVPVMRGFDMIDYSPSRVEHGTTSTETEAAIEWSGQRGIVTFAWHWNAPKDLIDQPGKEWWRGFYTEATTFDVSKAMNDQNSEEYTLIVRDIDVIAVQLKKLRDAKIPVLWRPLHEAEGKWFWWGAKGPEPCKLLWKLLFDRLVNHHGINNLIWVWTSTGNPSAIDWYPGDDCVDIIGADIYLPAGTYSSSFITFDNMVAMYEEKKIIALSENGPIPDPESLFIEGAAWSWFCTWSGSFITDGISNSDEHISDVFNHDYVITMDEIDNLDAIVAELDERREEMKNDDSVVTSVEKQIGQRIIFQNPVVNNHLSVRSESGCILKATLYNVEGKVEFESDNCYRIENIEFNLEGKPVGTFLLKVMTEDSVQVFRIIKF